MSICFFSCVKPGEVPGGLLLIIGADVELKTAVALMNPCVCFAHFIDLVIVIRRKALVLGITVSCPHDNCPRCCHSLFSFSAFRTGEIPVVCDAIIGLLNFFINRQIKLFSFFHKTLAGSQFAYYTV